MQDNKALTGLSMDNLQTVRGKMDLDGGFNTYVFFSLPTYALCLWLIKT